MAGPQLAFLVNEARFSDVTIKFENKRWPAHRCILAQCKRFSDCFYSTQHQVVEIEPLQFMGPLSPQVIDTFLRFFYTGRVSPSLSKDTAQLFGLARHYGFTLLEQLIECHWLNLVPQASTLNSVYQICELFHLEKLWIHAVNELRDRILLAHQFEDIKLQMVGLSLSQVECLYHSGNTMFNVYIKRVCDGSVSIRLEEEEYTQFFYRLIKPESLAEFNQLNQEKAVCNGV